MHAINLDSAALETVGFSMPHQQQGSPVNNSLITAIIIVLLTDLVVSLSFSCSRLISTQLMDSFSSRHASFSQRRLRNGFRQASTSKTFLSHKEQVHPKPVFEGEWEDWDNDAFLDDEYEPDDENDIGLIPLADKFSQSEITQLKSAPSALDICDNMSSTRSKRSPPSQCNDGNNVDLNYWKGWNEDAPYFDEVEDEEGEEIEDEGLMLIKGTRSNNGVSTSDTCGGSSNLFPSRMELNAWRSEDNSNRNAAVSLDVAAQSIPFSVSSSADSSRSLTSKQRVYAGEGGEQASTAATSSELLICEMNRHFSNLEGLVEQRLIYLQEQILRMNDSKPAFEATTGSNDSAVHTSIVGDKRSDVHIMTLALPSFFTFTSWFALQLIVFALGIIVGHDL